MKIAFFGTGFMGEPMATRLLEAGYPLTVWNRSVEKTSRLKQHGAQVADNPLEAASQADVSIIMLAHFPAIREVFFKEPLPTDFWKNKTFIMMSTIAPAESMTLKEEIEKCGGEYLESPVMGSIPQILAQKLLIMVGGTEEQFKKWDSLLAHFGDNRFYIGETGKAAAVKLAMNQMAITQSASFAMSIGYLREYGADTEQFMEILRESAYYSKGLERRLELFMKRDFSNTRFPLKLMLKDLELMIQRFSEVEIDISPLEGIRKILKEGVQHGYGDEDSMNLYNIIHPEK